MQRHRLGVFFICVIKPISRKSASEVHESRDFSGLMMKLIFLCAFQTRAIVRDNGGEILWLFRVHYIRRVYTQQYLPLYIMRMVKDFVECRANTSLTTPLMTLHFLTRVLSFIRANAPFLFLYSRHCVHEYTESTESQSIYGVTRRETYILRTLIGTFSRFFFSLVFASIRTQKYHRGERIRSNNELFYALKQFSVLIVNGFFVSYSRASGKSVSLRMLGKSYNVNFFIAFADERR